MIAKVPNIGLRRIPVIFGVVSAQTLILLMGAWAGMFETFGGYVWRNQIFLITALLIGFVGGFLLCRALGLHWGLAIGLVLVSRLIYGFGRAFGEALYVGPSDLSDFFEVLWLALNNRL